MIGDWRQGPQRLSVCWDHCIVVRLGDSSMSDRKRKLDVLSAEEEPKMQINPHTGRPYSKKYYDILAKRKGGDRSHLPMMPNQQQFSISPMGGSSKRLSLTSLETRTPYAVVPRCSKGCNKL